MGAFAGCLGDGDDDDVDGTDGDSGDSDDGGDGDDGGDDGDGGDDRYGGSLTAAWDLVDINELDPPYINHNAHVAAMPNYTNALLTINANGEIIGDAAKDWTVDGSEMEFELHEGITFHNGDSATAEDMAYSIRRVIENELPSISHVRNLQHPDEGGVEVVDEHTIKLVWEEPFAPAIPFLTAAGRVACFVSESAVEEMGRQQHALEPVGTGPFRITNHIVEESVEFERHDEYFKTDEDGNQLPYLDEMTIDLVPEDATATQGVEGGTIDFLHEVPPQNFEQLEGHSDVNTSMIGLQAWRGLEFNQAREPFDDPQFRLGVAKLLNQEDFINVATFGIGIPALGPLNPEFPPQRDDKPDYQAYDPEEGAELIRDAGYGGVEFEILARPSDLRLSETCRDILNESGVVSVSLDQVTGGEFSERTGPGQGESGDYDTWIGGSGHGLDPDQSLYNFYTPEGIWNWTEYDDETTQELLDEQRSVVDMDERGEILFEVEDRIMEHAVHAFTHHPAGTVAWQEYVKGYEHVPAHRSLERVWLDN